MQALLQLFTKRLVLLHDQRAYEEQKGQYLHEKYYAYSCLLGVVAEDAPFCVLNTVYILRVLQDDAEGVCSPGYTLFDFEVPMTLFPAVSPEPSIPLFFYGAAAVPDSAHIGCGVGVQARSHTAAARNLGTAQDFAANKGESTRAGGAAQSLRDRDTRV